jgi:rod shape determining protein RodA
MAKAVRGQPNAIKIDWFLLVSAALLLVVGLMSLFSEGYYRDHLVTFKKQVLYAAIGLVPFLIFYLTRPQFWAKIANALYAINVLSLLAVRLIGSERKGAERWIDIGPIQFQPSEMAKLLTILTLAAFFAHRKDKVKDLSTFLLSLVHIAVPVFLILIQPHLGAALVVIIAWAAICIVAGVPFKFLGGLLAGFAVLGVLVFAVPSVSNLVLHDYQKSRVKGMFTDDDQGRNYQTSRAEIALGEGGIMGTGYMHGSQKKANFIPEQQNDFIFTVIGEEGGLIGGSLLLLAFGFFFYRVWLIIFSARELYYRCIAAGIFAALFFHMFVNIAMVLEIVPVVGLWLPFLSYGGTALWLCLSCVGLLMGIRRSEKPVLFS